MWKTILRRVLMMIPQLFILSVLIFMLGQAVPGDAFTGMIDPGLTAEALEAMREAAGLNDPWPEQYMRWLQNLFQGDLGRSLTFRLPVAQVIGQRIGNSVLLSFFTVILVYLIAVPMGMSAGRHQNSAFDKFVGVYSYVTLALPMFIFALLTLFVFGFRLGWFPTSGSVAIGTAPGLPTFLSRLNHVILPAITQALLTTTGIVQMLRNQVIDAQRMDFVRTARSKGTPIGKVYTRHIFRNASLPIASNIGFVITGLIGGSVIIETVFSFPGMGQLLVSSVLNRDFAVVTSLTLLLGTASLFGMLISDIIMSVVDPRIRIQ